MARMLGADLEKGALPDAPISREALIRALRLDRPIELEASEVTSSPLPDAR
jgi:hypothetical protein